jgi:YesN/AraC family two-component response regulator
MQEIGISIDSCELSKSNVINNLLTQKSNYELKTYVLTLYLNVLQFKNKSKNSYTESIIEYAKRFIIENYSNVNLSVSYIAEQLHLSANYLSVLFKQVTGDNISTYITNLRLEKAKQLLSDPSVTMNNIAQTIGYSDSHYFAKVFKKMEGITPSEYRTISIRKLKV